MNRRGALSLLLSTALAGPSLGARRSSPTRLVRLLLFVGTDCAACQAVDLAMQDEEFLPKRWTRGVEPSNVIQVVNAREDLKLAERYNVRTLPAFVLVKNDVEIGRVAPEIVNPHEFILAGCSLFNGDDPAVTTRLMQPEPIVVVTRPAPLVVVPSRRVIVQQRLVERPVGYPIRPDWPFDGWIEMPWQHLAGDRNHSGRFPTPWLRSLSWAETQSLHGDHHRERKGIGRVHWEYVPTA